MDLRDFLTYELLRYFQEYFTWWNELSIEGKLMENQSVLEGLAASPDPSAREVASRIEKISNNLASLRNARNEGRINIADLEIELLAAKDSRIGSANSSKLLILETMPRKRVVMSIPYVKAEFSSESYGAYSLTAMLVHLAFGERLDELNLKGISPLDNELFGVISNMF